MTAVLVLWLMFGLLATLPTAFSQARRRMDGVGVEADELLSAKRRSSSAPGNISTSAPNTTNPPSNYTTSPPPPTTTSPPSGDLNIPKLSEEQRRECEGKISLEECSCLLDSFRDNKTPGNDGIPIEFYKKFWPLIGDSFIRCANECFEKGELSCSQKQAVITLIEKKGKDRSLLENWRPISLVNVDTKIMSKVIASRIKNVLPEIIHHNQTGYVKDRFIGETVRSIYDVMDYTVEENIPGLMIFIDFKKAFDSVEWDFLLKCLEAFNFGPDFIRWVKTFYKNIQSCTINNGTTTKYGLKSVRYWAANAWNQLPDRVRTIATLQAFRNAVRS
ncbi:hypothetical protein ACROYT_G042930 [Oculina patagonica]